MFAILHAVGMLVADLFKSRCRFEAEIFLLRHQLSIAMRRAPPRLRLRGSDCALLVWMTRVRPSLLDRIATVPLLADNLKNAACQVIQVEWKQPLCRFGDEYAREPPK
jgi:hypothetical protein